MWGGHMQDMLREAALPEARLGRRHSLPPGKHTSASQVQHASAQGSPAWLPGTEGMRCARANSKSRTTCRSGPFSAAAVDSRRTCSRGLLLAQRAAAAA